MSIPVILLAVTSFLSTGSSACADRHCVFVVDNFDKSSLISRLLVIDVDSGDVLLQAETGHTPVYGFSTDGKLLAVASVYYVAGRGTDRLEIFRTADLTRVQVGALPFPIDARHQSPIIPTIQFSPDGKELVVQRMESYMSGDKPLRLGVEEVVLTVLRLELDEQGAFKVSRQPLRVFRCRTVQYQRAVEFPRVHVWNSLLGAIEVLDFGTARILHRLPLGDDPVLATIDPVQLEKPNIGDLKSRLTSGSVVSSDGRYAYYIPRHPRQSRSAGFIGYIKKIDLQADPPKVIRQSEERQPDLRAGVSTVSEVGGGLWVVRDKVAPNGFTIQPSRQIRIFSTHDLKLLNEIEISLSDCTGLAASLDGKYVYALNHREGKMAVIEASTGREVKILDNVGKFPAAVIALPRAPGQE